MRLAKTNNRYAAPRSYLSAAYWYQLVLKAAGSSSSDDRTVAFVIVYLLANFLYIVYISCNATEEGVEEGEEEGAGDSNVVVEAS